MMTMESSVQERFWSKVRKTPFCWIWIAGCYPSGYGSFWYEGKKIGAHRIRWILHYGEILKNLNVLHDCDIKPCVNPEHLFLGTQVNNMQDASRKGKLKCKGAIGILNSHSKITEEDVQEIRRVGKILRPKEIAVMYDLSDTQVRRILNRKQWKHVQC